MFNLILLSLGLSADAATVSVGIGCSNPNLNSKKSLLAASSFGISQALMPILGALLGKALYSTLSKYSNIIVFAILGIIGLKTLVEGLKKDDSCKISYEINFSYIFPLAIATSIDAMAIGFILPMLGFNTAFACTVIGTITFFVCLFALKVGKAFGCRIKNYSEIIGGVLLLAIAFLNLLK